MISLWNHCSSEDDLQAELENHSFGCWIGKRLKDAPNSRHIPIFTKHTTSGLILCCSHSQQCKIIQSIPLFLLFYEGYKRLLQYRAKGNEDLICNLLLITPESNCRSHQHSCLVFLLKSRNKCYKFGLGLTVFSIPFTTEQSWTKVHFASCYCRVIAWCKAELGRNGLSLNYPERI